MSFLSVELMPKRLELLSELVPQAKTIALFASIVFAQRKGTCSARSGPTG